MRWFSRGGETARRTLTVAAACFLLAAAFGLGASAVLRGAEQASPEKPAKADPKWKASKPDPSKLLTEADNSYCLVCHINLEEEELVDIHVPVEVGCETCHGLSDEHSADEDNLTPPEILWAKERINPRCMTCHPREKMLGNETAAQAHRPVFRRWDDPKNAEPGEEHCTECHGEHRIHNRTRIWDKETGELVQQSGGPAMDQPSGRTTP